MKLSPDGTAVFGVALFGMVFSVAQHTRTPPPPKAQSRPIGILVDFGLVILMAVLECRRIQQLGSGLETQFFPGILD